ncbi:hypothetical protein TNCV_2831241 [Trichonephila clavipes]|nr:hypothetical protein TNCV_2831241 [Trichonephila clavipes]
MGHIVKLLIMIELLTIPMLIAKVILTLRLSGSLFKDLNQEPDSPEADLKRLFKSSMVVEDTFPKQTTEQWEDLTQLLDKFQGIFSQNKYDVGCINLEPQIIYLISEISISLRPYRNSQQESKEIQTQIEELLKAVFI